jgi:hypothetical protein
MTDAVPSDGLGGRHTRLAATPWPAEDGGPRRQQRPHGLAGPRAGSGELVASRQAAISVMALLAPPVSPGTSARTGPSALRLLVLRNSIGPGGRSWVEEVDPLTLEERRRSPDLDLGPFWPGGFGVLADGSVVVVQGRHVHLLDDALQPLATRAMEVEAPHNSFVVLDDGSLVIKDLQRPDGVGSTLSVLDPITLADRAAPLVLPEPSVARLAADGNDIIVVGVDSLMRVIWDPATGELVHDNGSTVRYRTRPDQSFGWDPVVDAGAVWWLDNGDHTYTNGFTFLGNGVADGPVRLWRVPLVDASRPGGGWDPGGVQSVEVDGAAGGVVTNPPIVDAIRGLAVAYDSANGVLAAFGTDDLDLRWRIPLNTSQHLVLYPDTGELVANDHDPASGDAVVVVDVTDGSVRLRVPVASPAQSAVFGCPGVHRDFIYVSLSTIARVVFGD